MRRGAFELDVRDLGCMAYAKALKLQRQIHTLVITGQIPPPGALLLVEHEPVVTISARKGAGENLLASRKALAAAGIDVEDTDRGGDITYHGPGQLVVYPVVRLAALGLNVGRYICLLEQVIIETAATFGIEGKRIEGQTGVWVETDGSHAKLGAIGVRVKRNVTLHGLSFNVTTNLEHFEHIIPCGLSNRRVTSLAALLGDECPSMADVKAAMVERFQAKMKRAD